MEERLQKIIARAGVASRRKAEELMRRGLVTVNGRVTTELGTTADPLKDHIKVQGKLLKPEPLEYFAVHKPRHMLSAVSDESGRPIVTSLVRSSRRLYPAGRLDFESEGLIILTNDGELTKFLTKAGQIEKVYRVKVQGIPSEEALERLRKGPRLEGEKLAPCGIWLLKAENNAWLEVRLKQGKNRQIRKMFDMIGHRVMRLRRTAIGGLELGDLAPGASRALSPRDLALLRSDPRKPAPGRVRSRKTTAAGPRTRPKTAERKESTRIPGKIGVRDVHRNRRRTGKTEGDHKRSGRGRSAR